MTLVIENAAVATVDAAGTEYADGHVAVDGGRIVAVGPGPAPAGYAAAERVDGTGCLVTPGLVNTHNHLYQWATRGYGQDSPLFDWLTELYPVWTGLTEDIAHAAASAGLAWLALTGATTAADHHYIYPRGGGDLFTALVSAGGRVGLRLHAVRGSMDRGRSHGGLPPDEAVESTDAALEATERAIAQYHDRSAEAMVRVAVGPCSPFTVSSALMRDAAELARRHGVRLHTHLSETLDEERQCQREHGCTAAEYAEDLGWLGADVWFAHTVHLDAAAVKRLGATGTGAAHCPTSNGRLGAGIAGLRELLDASAPVGLGVDGAASNERGGMLDEAQQAVITARACGGASALTVRDALRLATMGGAECLGRAGELGSVEVGKLADLAVWRMDGLGHAGIADPVAALVLGPRPPLARLLVGGEPVVVDGELHTTSEREITGELRGASRALARKAEARR